MNVKLSNLTSLARYNENPINTSISEDANGGLLLKTTGHIIGLSDDCLNASSPSPSSITFSPGYEDYGAREGSLLDILKEIIAKRLGIKQLTSTKTKHQAQSWLKALVRATSQTHTP